MMHYKLIKIIINTPGLAKMIINIVIYHYALPDLIVTNKNSLFT